MGIWGNEHTVARFLPNALPKMYIPELWSLWIHYLTWRKRLVDMIQLMLLIWGDYPGLYGWTQSFRSISKFMYVPVFFLTASIMITINKFYWILTSYLLNLLIVTKHVGCQRISYQSLCPGNVLTLFHLNYSLRWISSPIGRKTGALNYTYVYPRDQV